MSHPSNLRSETLNMVLLPVQHILGDKQRERAVLHAQLLDMCVEPLLDLFPDEIRSRLNPSVKEQTSNCLALYLKNEAARDIVVVQHITLGKDLLIPSREILLFRHINTDQSGAFEFLLRGL